MSSLLTFTNRQQLLRETKDYLFIALGMIMYAVGWTVFLLPNNLPSGAVPGIASVVYWATGFPVQYTYLLINFALLLLALKILGLSIILRRRYRSCILGQWKHRRNGYYRSHNKQISRHNLRKGYPDMRCDNNIIQLSGFA